MDQGWTIVGHCGHLFKIQNYSADNSATQADKILSLKMCK